MESTQNLKRRIRSVQNIGQITKAMELVAATKMRRAQELALNSRPYAYTALEILAVISRLKDSQEGIAMPPLMRERTSEAGDDDFKKTGRTAFMIVTSDKGLAGSFNGSVFRKFEQYVRENNIDLQARTDDGREKYVFIAVGQKSKSYLEHRGLSVSKFFTRVGDFTRMEEVNPITDALIDGYLGGPAGPGQPADTATPPQFDEVISFSTQFITALNQQVFARQLLPVSFEKVRESIEQLVPAAGKYSKYLETAAFADGGAGGAATNVQYLIEPSPREVLEKLSRELLKIRVYHSILEANASEHSARRVAMKNASDNASELSQDLNIVYNKSRQAAITNQIIEVTSGAQAAGVE
jgi:F-type H+-transporting ATPase subunit gamma